MASTSAPQRSARACLPLPQPADAAIASTSALRRSARARRPLPQPADHAAASTSAPRRSARARRPPADRAAASTSARRRSARGPAAQAVLPDEILEEIFLRLDAAADLVRASAACSSFRRIVSDGQFLRRFRSLRSPAVLGFSDGDVYVPVDPPHRCGPEARALVQAADFTFSFLPEPSGWRFRHACDGRVLLARRISPDTDFEDLTVCDPLYRRYVEIPRIPDDLLASAAYNGCRGMCSPFWLQPAMNDEEESFRVICTVQLKGKVVVFIFSSCNQTWRGIISTIDLPLHALVEMPYYAHSCVHWMLDCLGYPLCKLLMLDTSEMEFSIIDVPPTHIHESDRGIVEAEEGRLGLLTISNDTVHLYCKNWQKNGVAAQEWQHDKLIPLPKDSRLHKFWRIAGTAGRYVGLVACLGMHCTKYFVLDIKTLLLEELCTLKNGVGFYGFPYARFPPPLALPSI